MWTGSGSRNPETSLSWWGWSPLRPLRGPVCSTARLQAVLGSYFCADPKTVPQVSAQDRPDGSAGRSNGCRRSRSHLAHRPVARARRRHSRDSVVLLVRVRTPFCPCGPPVAGRLSRSSYFVFSAPIGLGAGGAYIRLLEEHGSTRRWAGRWRRVVRTRSRSILAGATPRAQPLVAPFRREFHVRPPRERTLDPADWRQRVPVQGIRDRLAVLFPAPLDYGPATARARSGDRRRPAAGWGDPREA